MSFGLAMFFRKKIVEFGVFLIAFVCLVVVDNVQKASCETYTINTNSAPTISGLNVYIKGETQERTFKGPNEELWNYSVAVFHIPSHNKSIFEYGNTIEISGNNSLSINTTGDFKIGTDLNLSGQEVRDNDNTLFLFGGFVRRSNSCCVLGAGPGAAFTFHGGGHGGRGGGFYQDHNTSRYYSWDYHNDNYLLGGSTSTVVFEESKSGSGGGAIEIIAHKGNLTIDAAIKADGFSSKNTTGKHCAGGSSGGLIRLKADMVTLSEKGRLSANGGNGGYSSSTTKHCGDGGGGGVIQVFYTFDNSSIHSEPITIQVDGGRGINDGEKGVMSLGVFFDNDLLEINTSDCTMKWLIILVHQGQLVSHNYRTPNNQMRLSYKVCVFTFKSSLHIGKKAQISIVGMHALKIVSKNGNIELFNDFNLNGKSSSKQDERSLGGFVMTNLNGDNVGPGNTTNCNAIKLYANDFETLLGGSVCKNTKTNTPVHSEGGGAIELVAKAGTIVIGSSITVNGYSDNPQAGSMGGFIRLDGKRIQLKDSASFSAKPSYMASGGIIQIKSDEDVEGLCEKKFDVTGSSNGLVNIMVSSKMSYQVQYIQEGTLLINTTLCIWVHRTHTNYSMAYSQFGTLSNVTKDEITTTICTFDFKTPIIVNGSVNVTLAGDHVLSIKSEQGIYIGADFVIDSHLVVDKSRFLGGYCVKEASLAKIGHGPGTGKPNTNSGGGHGGRGGLFFEENGRIYGKQYGVQPFVLIGGSTGTSNESQNIRGCGGGAIKIVSMKNLTINAAIRANGYSAPMFDHLGKAHGGSSGGSIYLEANQVIIEDAAVIEAKGSDGQAETGNTVVGGGGGGVIVINSTKQLIGNQPNPAIATIGGVGYKQGESGLVIINGQVYLEPRNPGVEMLNKSTKCSRVQMSLPKQYVKMLEHTARPKTCLDLCIANSTLYAVIRNKLCYCMNQNESFEVRNVSMCNLPCSATYNYSCGGESPDVYSVYTTGIKQPPTIPVTEPSSTTMSPTTRPFDQASTEFIKLNKINITTNNSQEVVHRLVKLTKTTELNGGDTSAAVNIIIKLATGNVLAPTTYNEAKQTGEAIIETASLLLSNDNEENWKKLGSMNTTEEPYSPNNLLEAIEKIAIDLGNGLEAEENVTMETNHVAMGIVKRSMVNYTGEYYPQYSQFSDDWQFKDKIFIPAETTKAFKTRGDNQATIFFVLYNRINKALESNLNDSTVINSMVMSLGFDRELVHPLPKPVIISFTKYQMDNLTDPVCSFLDFQNTTVGHWSNYGCKLTSSEGSIIQCECNHLTNFAVLMQVKQFKVSDAHRQALQMITYIGCGISLFGLALTLATFLSLETLASERTSIHKNLVVAIGLAQIIFLAGIDVVYNPIACKIVALSLHYLYTAAFTWMCCEGLHLYTKVIEVFSSEASKMKYYYMLGWGVPLIIVIISAASRMEGYGSETACWISIDHGLIWAFVGPVLVIMCINFVVMVMVIKVILASVTSIQNPGNTSQVKAGLKGMVVLLPLLGLTWVFGLMAVNEKTIAFQYVFAILNSLQGLFIFAFHCIGNSEVRVAYKRLHEKRTLAKSLPEHSLSSGNHHKNVEEFKKRMNSRETNSTGDEDVIVTKAIRSVSDVKLSGGTDHVAMQTFGDADSGRWSLNCPSPDPPFNSDQTAGKKKAPRKHNVRKLRPEKDVEVTETTHLTDTDITGEVSTVTKAAEPQKVALTDIKDFKKSRQHRNRSSSKHY